MDNMDGKKEKYGQLMSCWIDIDPVFPSMSTQFSIFNPFMIKFETPDTVRDT